AGGAAPVGGLDRPPARHPRLGDGIRLPQLLSRGRRRERHPVAGRAPGLRGGDQAAGPVRTAGPPVTGAQPPLAGKGTLVVRDSTGSGADAARVLAADGAAVMLVARREEPLAALAAELESAGRRAAYTTGDVADAGAVARFVDETAARFGRLDGAYNNAAI